MCFPEAHIVSTRTICPGLPGLPYTVCPQAVAAIWFVNKSHLKVCPIFCPLRVRTRTQFHVGCTFEKMVGGSIWKHNFLHYCIFSHIFSLHPNCHKHHPLQSPAPSFKVKCCFQCTCMPVVEDMWIFRMFNIIR